MIGGAGLAARAIAMRIGLFYAGYFIFLGLFVPYWPVWLQLHGLTAGQIGLLIAMTQLLKASTSPVIAQVSDASGRRRDMLLAAAMLSLASFGLFAFVDGYRGILLVTMLSHLFLPALLPLNEQMALAAVRRHGIHYGRTRSVGSIAFILGSLAGGAVMARYGAGSIFWFAFAALGVPVVAAFLLPRDDMRTRRPPSRLTLAPILKLLRQPGLAFFFVLVSLIQGSHGVYYVFGTIHWNNIGLDARAIGGLWGLAVLAEVLLFIFLGDWVARRPSRQMLAVAAAAGTLRWLGLGLAEDMLSIALLQCLHAITYGATHLATMSYLARHVSEDRAATAQALYSAIPMGLATGATLALSGLLYDLLGGGAYFAMALMTASVLVIFARIRWASAQSR